MWVASWDRSARRENAREGNTFAAEKSVEGKAGGGKDDKGRGSDCVERTILPTLLGDAPFGKRRLTPNQGQTASGFGTSFRQDGKGPLKQGVAQRLGKKERNQKTVCKIILKGNQ